MKLWEQALGRVCVGAAICAVPSTAIAQDEGQIASQAADYGVTDIVVTARRRAEASQTVPLAISAFSGDQLTQHGVRSVEDLRQISAGVNISGQKRDEANFYIRGQGPGVVQVGQRNFTSVATYFAEVPTVLAGPGSMYDLQTVQILKGPQGTLFGRNTTGGAVIFEPAAPTDAFEGNAAITIGNHDLRQFNGVINLPMGQNAALRVAAEIADRDGYTRNVITGQKLDGRAYQSMRATLLLRPFEGLENRTIFDGRLQDNSGTSAMLRQINPAAAFGAIATPPSLAGLLGLPAGTSVSIPLRAGGSVPVACAQAALPGCPAGPYGSAVAAIQAAYNGGNFTDPAAGGFALIAPTAQLLDALKTQQALGARQTQIPRVLRTQRESWGVTNKTSFELSDSVTLRNIIAFRQSRSAEEQDYDGAPFRTIETFAPGAWSAGQDQFTEEFQIQGEAGSRLNYILGYYHEFSKPGFTPVQGSYSLGSTATRILKNRDVSDAVFAHAEYQFADGWQLSGGVRYTWDKRRAALSIFDTAGACTQIDPANPGTQVNPIYTCPITYNAKFSAPTYDATLQYEPMNGVLLYAAYRHGYKSGGFNLPSPVPEFQRFDQETVDDFELGLKADWDIGFPLRTNIAVFYDKYKDIQIQEPVAVQGVGITSLVRNAGKATNKGFEFEAHMRPLEGLGLSAFVSYIDAHCDVTLPGTSCRKGVQSVFQPKWKYGVSGRYELPLGSIDELVAIAADYSWQAKAGTNDLNAPINHYAAYGLLNARLEWNGVGGSSVDAALFATNLTNKTYVAGGYPLTSQIGFESVFYGEPRMYGMSLKFRWKQ